MTSALALLGLVPAGPAVAAPQVSVSPTALEFGDVAVGATATIPVVITNKSGSPITPGYAGGAPFDAVNFGVSQNCAGAALNPGGSCEFRYTFSPKTAGAHSTTTTIQISDGSGTATYGIYLRGYGGVSLALSTTALDFGNVAAGGSAQRTVQVTNRAPTTFGPLSLSGGEPPSAEFAASLSDCQGRTLGPGDSCRLVMTFAPTAPAGRRLDAADLTIDRGGGALVFFGIVLTGCEPLCGPQVRFGRTVALKLKGHLKATGKVSSPDGGSQCVAGLVVDLQRRHGRKWKSVDTTITNTKGKFRESIPDRPGSYRAFVASRSVDAGAALCPAASSKPRPNS
jgi:hypothetical protein